MIYAMLGSIVFTVQNAPTALSENHRANFAEHKTIDGRPKLQALGTELTEINLSISLNYKTGGVESRYQALVAAKESQKALPLIFGWSKIKGNFVITELKERTLFSDAYGNALKREIDLVLLEFVGDTQEHPIGLALQTGANKLIGGVLPATARDVFTTLTSTVSAAIKVYKNVKRYVLTAKDVFNTIKNSPSSLLSIAYLLPSLIKSTDSLLVDIGVTATSALDVDWGEWNMFASAMSEMYFSVSDLKNYLTADKTTNPHWLENSENSINQLNNLLDEIEPVANTMTSWVIMRNDREVINDANMAHS